eukprot:CAMPEP_0171875660 /NCGR_PEP_ID=MMETSP0992-20121227/35674_1 /TAXON_ID=483369 /ORGANISM="non described non described, Strain CCMP2098" /LENGTH=116 /DNA_ID=CAMNT_0012500643 /DNA_START=381 /DNA_END=731 /DNA_ORIENTATION=+
MKVASRQRVAERAKKRASLKTKQGNVGSPSVDEGSTTSSGSTNGATKALRGRVADAIADHTIANGAIANIVGGAIEHLSEGKDALAAERKGDPPTAAVKRRAHIARQHTKNVSARA